MIELQTTETKPAPPAPPPGSMSGPVQMRISNAPLVEVLTLLAVLRDYVTVTVLGERSETWLFERGLFVGSTDALSRLRALLVASAKVEVTLASHGTLAGLFGPPVAAMALVLDPEDKLRA